MSQELVQRCEENGRERRGTIGRLLNGLLQGRAQTPEEIALAALFLCSSQSSAMPANPSTSMVASRLLKFHRAQRLENSHKNRETTEHRSRKIIIGSTARGASRGR